MALCVQERLRKPLLEKRTVGQTGERIMVREMREAFFRELAIGDVQKRTVHTGRAAVGIECVFGLFLNVPHRSVGQHDAVVDAIGMVM